MATPDIFDFARLTAPISDAQPTGPWLRDDPAQRALYYKIKDTADSSRSSERQMRTAERDDEGGLKENIELPAWDKLEELAIDALATKSKDLWIAAWLIEAEARQNGFAGLRDSFRLVRELCEKYWPDLYPPPDEDDLADGTLTSMVQLAGLNGVEAEGTLAMPILSIPITNSPDLGALTSADYLQAAKFAGITDPEARQRRLSEGAISMDAFESAARSTPPAFFNDLLEDVAAAIAEFEKMNEVLAAKCGKDDEGRVLWPPSSSIHKALEECLDRIKAASRGVVVPKTETKGASKGDTGNVTSGPGLNLLVSNLANREAAFQELLKIADFFAQTEPHSPVSYALRQVVSWGKMSLPELMTELIDEEAVRANLFRRTGIPKPQTPAT